MVGPNAVKQRRQHNQDVKPGFALDMGQLPNGAKLLTGIAVVRPRRAEEHNVVFHERPKT